MAVTERHMEVSDRFLAQAEAEFEKGDLLQASEKAWGAVAHYVKSVASEQGWPNRSHRDVNQGARRLIGLTDDPKLNAVRLGAANALHQNFYEDWFDRGQVMDSVESARDLVAAMREARKKLPSIENLGSG